MKLKIGFAGLSHLGIISSLASADMGIETTGYDFDNNIIEKLNNFKNIISEKGVSASLQRNLKSKKIFFTNKINDLRKCNIIFISKDVKTNSSGVSDTKEIDTVIKKIKSSVSKKKILVIMSQIPPGFTSKVDWDKKKLFYQVETLIFGKALERAKNPERLILGMSDKKITIPKIYSQYLNAFKAPIIKMNYQSAELCKISINMLLISNISISNFLSNLCEKINADWSSISPALKLDKRIGKHAYISPGLGLSGGNLERDLVSLKRISDSHKLNTDLLNSYNKVSKINKNWISNILNRYINKNSNFKIALLGLTYKEDTNSLKNAQSIYLIKKYKNLIFYGYDPIINDIGLNNFISCNNIKEALVDAKIVIILHKSNFFKNISKKTIFSLIQKECLVIDPFRVFIKFKFASSKFKYYSLGIKDS